MSSWVMVTSVPCAIHAMDMQIKAPQSYEFSCFGESSAPVVFESVHDQILVCGTFNRLFSPMF